MHSFVRTRKNILTVITYKKNTGRMGLSSGFVIKRDKRKDIVLTCQHVVSSFRKGDRLCVRRRLTVGVEELSAKILYTC